MYNRSCLLASTMISTDTLYKSTFYGSRFIEHHKPSNTELRNQVCGRYTLHPARCDLLGVFQLMIGKREGGARVEGNLELGGPSNSELDRVSNFLPPTPQFPKGISLRIKQGCVKSQEGKMTRICHGQHTTNIDTLGLRRHSMIIHQTLQAFTLPIFWLKPLSVQ